MNRQKVFDTVLTHLRTQNRRAVNGSGGCVYRSPEGLKCAIGCLIPDELYRSSMEGTTVSGLLADYPELDAYFRMDENEDSTFEYRSGTYETNYQLLQEFQMVHDFSLEDLEFGMLRIARTFKLEYAAPKKEG